MTDQEISEAYGLTLEQVAELRRELREGSPRVRRIMSEMGEALEILADPSDEARDRFLSTPTGQAFKAVCAPPAPAVSEETLVQTLALIEAMRQEESP